MYITEGLKPITQNICAGKGLKGLRAQQMQIVTRQLDSSDGNYPCQQDLTLVWWFDCMQNFWMLSFSTNQSNGIYLSHENILEANERWQFSGFIYLEAFILIKESNTTLKEFSVQLSSGDCLVFFVFFFSFENVVCLHHQKSALLVNQTDFVMNAFPCLQQMHQLVLTLMFLSKFFVPKCALNMRCWLSSVAGIYFE